MMKRISLLKRKVGNSGLQTNRKGLNFGMGRIGARGSRHIRTVTNASVTEEERITGE